MPGPPPKPAERRQRHTPASMAARMTGLAVAPAEPTVPDPPPGLLAATRRQWEGFWRSPLAQQVTAPTDLPAMQRLYSLYDERARALAAYRRQRLVEGSMGQPVVNPLAKVIQQMDAELRFLEDRFGLTPLARMRLGVVLGDAAKSLDRLTEALDDDPGDAADDPRHRVVDSSAVAVAADARAAGL